MFNIFDHKEMQIKTTQILTHHNYNDYHQENNQQHILGRMWGEVTSYAVDENVN
jgi:hypothetical protein